MFGIENKKALKVVSKFSLTFLVQEEASKDNYLQESGKFAVGCYGTKK